MAISTLLKINNQDISGLAEYGVQPNRLYTDAGRNLAGELKAQFIGRFPKIMLNFTYLTAAQMAFILPLLQQESFLVAFWDADTEAVKTGTFYAGDFQWNLWDKTKEMYKPFNVNLIPYSKIA